MELVSFVIENTLEHFPRFDASFYRSSGGAEIDLILEKGGKKIAIEIRSSASPSLGQVFYKALKAIEPD